MPYIPNEFDFKNYPGDENNVTFESFLDGYERILWRAKPVHKSYVLAAVFKLLVPALVFFFFDTFMILMMSSGGSIISGIFIPFLVVFFIIHLTPFWMWIANIVKAKREVKNIEYVCTDKKIIIKNGIVATNYITINYEDIYAVNLKIGMVDKMCKCGDVYINANTQRCVFYDIKDAEHIYKVLMNIINKNKEEQNKNYNSSVTYENVREDFKF